MSTRKHTPRNRGFRPEADVLESRQLLSAVVSGTDSKGDAWSLRLVGPGQLSVVKQNGAGGTTPGALTSATDINTITIGGTDPLKSRLVGTVTPGPNSDGRVFFQSMNQLATRSEKYTGSGDGLLSIDMPNFWLANTTPATRAPTSAPGITLPDGVDTLRFGGVDTSVNQPTTANATNNAAVVSLGLPTFGGTRILINKSISSTQAGPPATNSPAPTTVQHGVVFAVAGRLQLFQANEIVGDAASPPGQFKDFNPAAAGTGGTLVVSTTPGSGGSFPFLSALFPSGQTKGAVTGAIADVRVGGNATNFSTFVFDPSFSGGDKIANFSIGGETNNVLLVAPTGARNVVFGKGMDKVEILTHVMDSLQANRGALNSNVYVDRSIGRVDLGGDVVNTRVLAGYQQNYNNILSTIAGNSFGTSPAAPPTPINAQPFGALSVHVAGSVTNSVFAASVEPFQNNFAKFGDPNQIVLTGGHINSKIEGKVDNTVAAPNTPKQAVFASQVKAYSGPVVPPNVPEAPYPGPAQPSHLPGIHHPNRSLVKVVSATTATPVTTTPAVKTPTTTPVTKPAKKA